MVVSDRMGNCESAAHVVPATEMRSMKAVASGMKMTSAMAAAVAVTTTAVTAAASGQRGAGQHGRQSNSHNPSH
ncbi:hypothetical protein [Bradyrhizobium lablabi]|uniref:hypothetical protein n=1 Tax=Bradyrhizobium lablabi TaxID=722472 RepID=UPI0032E51B4E